MDSYQFLVHDIVNVIHDIDNVIVNVWNNMEYENLLELMS